MSNAYFIKGSFSATGASGGAVLPSAPSGPGGVVNTPFTMGHTTPLAFAGNGATWNTGQTLHTYTLPRTTINNRFLRFTYYMSFDAARANSNLCSLTVGDPSSLALNTAIYTMYQTATSLYVNGTVHLACENNQLRGLAANGLLFPWTYNTTAPTFMSTDLSNIETVNLNFNQFTSVGTVGKLHATVLEVL